MIKISRIEICVGGAKRWPAGGTVVKSNYTNGYSGLGWSTANTQQSLMKNGSFSLPLSVHLVAECWCHSHSQYHHDAYDQCERDLYF